MKLKKLGMMLVFVLVAVSMVTSLVAAEDGVLFRKNVSKTPDLETEKAAIFMMDFYVPAQASTGELVSIDNYDIETVDESGALVVSDGYLPREYAKPLVSVYIDGSTDISFYEEGFDDAADGGIVFGAFDAFVGLSLDDGTTWKTTNLSRSADLSSFDLDNGTAYPGHVHNVVHQVFGDNILVAYVSKYCEGGTPLYSLTPEVGEDDSLNEAYLTDLEDNYGKDAVYLYDLFGIGGDQGSVDYTDQGWPEVGQIPFSCVWTTRGKLLAGDDPSTEVVEAVHVMWTKPERLTSGKRDANLPAVDCAAGAGCMLTWQEDPEGLRPGQGLGPGEGWSGAVAWQQTDIWYSHISQADFDIVFSTDAEDETAIDSEMTLAEYLPLLQVDTTGELSNQPKPYVPMAAPARLTDNAMCKGFVSIEKKADPYCWIDFDTLDVDATNVDEYLDTLASSGPEEGADFCTETYPWSNPSGVELDLCVTKDNRILNGRVASTRVRMNFKPYTKTDGTKSAWIVMAAEESKALGESNLVDDTVEPVDIGKDVFYYSFDPFKTGVDEIMVQQGGMLNQPAQCNYDSGLDDPLCDGIEEGEFYPIQYDGRDTDANGTVEEGEGYPFYLTEIARRFALTTNSVKAAVDSLSGLSAMLIYKQGIINQGGPADIMLRRVLIPDDFDPAVDNPYDYKNMECADWEYEDGSNPNYLEGLCLSPAINITGTTIVTCEPDATDSAACADLWPLNDDGSNNVDGDFPKIYEWRQCDGTADIEGCEDDNDLDDQVWENPYDVAKGHRGFLDGDFVMMMYAWAPNWNSNAVGNDHYNLYARRSFDGGATWTTTPAALGGAGVTYFEYYYDGSIGVPLETEWTYAAGDFEQGRNVSLLTGNKITILDPRYSPTGGMKLYPTISTAWLETYADLLPAIESDDTLPYDDDLARDPSKFFMIYETGDNTTVAEGEATPLDLYYSRATVYGDFYEIMDYKTETDDLVLDRWPWVENKADILSGEASMLVNPGGTFMYAVWNQWQEELKTYVDEYGIVHEEEHIFDSDMMFRRFMYLPDDTTLDLAPIASILKLNTYAFSWLTDDAIVINATAVDLDDDEIVEYVWTYYGSDGKVSVVGSAKELNTSVRNLPGWAQTPGQPGWAKFGFKVKDSTGQWSKEVKVEVLIAEAITRIYNPMVLK